MMMMIIACNCSDMRPRTSMPAQVQPPTSTSPHARAQCEWGFSGNIVVLKLIWVKLG